MPPENNHDAIYAKITDVCLQTGELKGSVEALQTDMAELKADMKTLLSFRAKVLVIVGIISLVVSAGASTLFVRLLAP